MQNNINFCVILFDLIKHAQTKGNQLTFTWQINFYNAMLIFR